VHAFVTSRLDYCNSLYAYSSVSTCQRLQRVQNCAAHLVADAPRRASSRPLLHQLHWLPVEAWITYKLCTLMYRIFNGTRYSAAISGRTLSTLFSRSTAILVVSGLRCTTNKRLADSSFSAAGPTAWNSLPVEFHRTSTYSSFCNRLKTFFMVALCNRETIYGRPM